MSGGVLAHVEDTAWSVVLAVLPIVLLFLLFQLLFLQLPAKEVTRILTGTLVAAIGLFVFLLGVSIALLPFGRAVGGALGGLSDRWIAVVVGMLLGFATTWGEPSVRILADQVEDSSSGFVGRTLVTLTVCAGVAVAVGVGLLRILYGIPFLYLAVPGYLFVVAAMWFCESDFVGIAVDAGGVATGPLANTFLLALAFGVTSATADRDPLVHGLGLLALISLAPVMSVMLLGLVVRWNKRKQEP